ncbi:hypothetical protein AN958_06804 [Leucoagaricus sp. SymC.cos]|nr:hypothetical protein AN958_06804 [Leucoagaricus sp. SymC.cos]
MTLDHRLLPPELWLEILLRAVQPSSRESDAHSIEYAPFQPAPNDHRDSTLSVKRTLRLVCRLWRLWTVDVFYRDIKIRHGLQTLSCVLDSSCNQENYGRMVQRAILPYPSTISGPARTPTLTSIEILRHCTKLEVLVRPRCLLTDALQFDYEVGCVPLPSLRRLEWWHHTEAERSGGINSLGVVLQHAPNIQHLFIGGVVGYIQFTNVCLPALRTLRLHVINGLLLHQIVSKWVLPSLTHVVLDSPLVEQGLQSVWDGFGQQLEVVEFGKHLRFLMSDHLTTCLRGCPALQEIGYFIFFTKAPETFEEHAFITTVRLHSAVNNFLYTAEEVWAILEGHFRFFTQLTSLRRIILYGEWRGILSQRRFQEITQRFRDTQAHVALELGDGSNVSGCSGS